MTGDGSSAAGDAGPAGPRDASARDAGSRDASARDARTKTSAESAPGGGAFRPQPPHTALSGEGEAGGSEGSRNEGSREASREAGRDDAGWLARTIELATQNVAAGGGPFGALIVRDGALLATGQNRVTRDNDPTAHAEVVAIRSACASIGDFSLDGATLYTSCEPCPLCLSAALWARVARIVFAANRDDAARGGFDDREFYELFARDRSTWAMPVESQRPSDANAPFDAWLSHPDRTAY